MTMEEMNKPQISLIVSCSAVERQVRTFLDNIARTQTTEQIELFLVSWEEYNYQQLVDARYWNVHAINFPRTEGLNQGLAQAVVLSSAPIVVFLEDHTRMEGDLVSVLPKIYAEGHYSGVGWVIKPGNTESLISWMGFLAEYGYWGPGLSEGPRRNLIPGHNCSYLRSELLALGEELSSYLAPELVFQWKLLDEGKQFYFTTSLSMGHFQFVTMQPFWKANFWYSWNLAASRSTKQRWSLFKKLLYAVAIFLKPIVRWKVLLTTPRDHSYYPKSIVLQSAPGITFVFLIASVGESLGYLFGFSRKSVIEVNRYELGFDRGAE